MPFCTDCGKKLPDNAVFCPNCGHRSAPVPKTPDDSDKDGCGTQQQYNINQQAPDTEDPREQHTAEDSSSYERNSSSQGCSAPAYGLDPNIYKSSSQTQSAEKSGSKTAVIVICTVLALLIIAAVLTVSLIGSDSEYIGYWESVEVIPGNGFYLPDIYGEGSQSLIALQVEKDHSVYLVSAFEDDVMSGTWEASGKGFEAEINDDELDFIYSKKDNTLTLIGDEGFQIVFERSDGSIYGAGTRKDLSTNSGDKADRISGSGSVGDDSYYISVTGAEHFSDIDGSAAMRVYFEFTNNSGHNASVRSALECYARQDGKKLTETYTWDDVEIYGNTDRYIRPGVKIQCCYEFKCNSKGGSVDFILFDYNLGTNGGTVTATYTPGELPGRPAIFSIKTVSEPMWTASLPGEGYLDEDYYVSVTDAELVYDYYGNAAIRVYYEFTNNSSDEIALADALSSFAYQDGVSLDSTYTMVNSETDDNYYEETGPGETVRASCVFMLRNDSSPVEAEIGSAYSYSAVGQTYKIS